MGFIRRALDFLLHPSHSRTIGILIVFVLLAVVSLTVYVAQQQQQLEQRAADEIPAVCSAIDFIPTCSAGNPRNNPCAPEGEKCRVGNTIYECKK